MKKLVIASSLAVASFAAAAQTYIETGYTAVNYKEPYGDYTVQAKPKAISVLAGYDLNENVALEGMVSFDLDEAPLKFGGESVGAKLKVKNLYAVFVRPKARLSEHLEVFARLGFARTTLSASDDNSSDAISNSDADTAYGVGANVYLGQAAYVTANYMYFYNKDDAKASALTIGLGYRF